MNVLSIHSQVVYGHVGNSAAAFALARLGIEAWAVPTVLFSNHPGHGGFRGRIADHAVIAELIDGLDERGWLARADAVLVGYLGAIAIAEEGARTVARLRAHRRDALVLVDPVLGDRPRGLYVRPDLAEWMREHLVPAAGIMTPNGFELEYLTGGSTASLESTLAAARSLRERGPEAVIVTSIGREDGPPGMVEALAVDGTGAWLAAVPALAGAPNGAGDLFAALLLARRLKGDSLPMALGVAMAATWAVIEQSVALGMDELALIPAQERLITPGVEVLVRAIG